MRLLFLGDLVGRAGRTAVIEALPKLRADWKLDFVAVNGENSASGFGITAKIADELFRAGADVVTLGDHAFDQKEMLAHIGTEPRLLRPLNFAPAAPGRGHGIFTATRGRKVLVAVALGRVFMNRPFDDPFSALDAVLKTAPLGGAVQAALVEIHAEATSEKMAVGHWCDGRASLVIGTHTHVPTADATILNRGTAYQSDAGMCGDYDSVIGMDKGEPLKRFITGMHSERFQPALGEATICGTLVETDDRTGLAQAVRPVRLGGRLAESAPAG
ncbi:MAG TPA: TIGR00282 family metallophosphoesterase [Paracoccaceae bacterium]|nr:TIGR00282 family metallophosphoesterase [Paracoccaceae bacterium]